MAGLLVRFSGDYDLVSQHNPGTIAATSH